MSAANAEIKLPKWMPRDAQETWTEFYSLLPGGSAREAKMLKRLATRPVMKEAWAELTQHFKGVAPGILLTQTLLTWLSAMFSAMRNQPIEETSAPKTAPSFAALASHARTLLDALHKIDPTIRIQNEITKTTLNELDRVAAFFDQEAGSFDRVVNIAPFPRKRGAHNVHQIMFVNAMCDWLSHPGWRRRPYKLVAILINVAFSLDEEWDADRVKHCYLSRYRKK